MTAVEMRVEGGNHPLSKDAWSALFNLLQSSFKDRVQQPQILQDGFTTGRFERQRQDRPYTGGGKQSTVFEAKSEPHVLHDSTRRPKVLTSRRESDPSLTRCAARVHADVTPLMLCYHKLRPRPEWKPHVFRVVFLVKHAASA